MTNAPIRVLVADDSAVVRKGLADLLAAEADFFVVGFARHGREAVAMVTALRPDVVLMDIAMPIMNGLAATRLILAAHPEVRVVGLTAHADAEYVEYMAAAGAVGFVSKHCSVDRIPKAVRACANGKLFFGPWAIPSLNRRSKRPAGLGLRPLGPAPEKAAGRRSPGRAALEVPFAVDPAKS